jgi:glycosyltransferase involved in cell wall biosynthesis
MTTPVLTVLIDTYNYGHFIEQAIESVLSQDFPMDQLEILVVDDGSTDDTADRMKKYGSKINYLRKSNGGQASAFNFGLARARGEIVFLLDADDYFLSGKVRRVVEEFQKHPEVGMIYHSLELLDTTSSKLKRGTPGFAPISGFLPGEENKLHAFYAHQTSSLAFRMGILRRLLPVPDSLRIQADAFIELTAVLLAPILALSEPLAVYRIHGKNLSYPDWAESTPEALQRRAASYVRVLKEVRAWIRGHRKDLQGVDTSRYLVSQLFEMEETQFLAAPPSRIDHFLFLLRRNHAWSKQQSWRFTAFNYLIAFLALAFRYSKARSMHKKLWTIFILC